MFNSRRVWQISSTLVIGSDKSTLLRHLQAPFSSLHSLVVIIWFSFFTFNTLFSNLLNQFYTELYYWFSSSTLFLISLKGGLIEIDGDGKKRQGPICSLSSNGSRELGILSRSSFALSNWYNNTCLAAHFLIFFHQCPWFFFWQNTRFRR